VEDGVIPVVGGSALGVGAAFIGFPAAVLCLDRGGIEVADGVLGSGSGGNEDGATSAFSTTSTLAGDVTILRTLGEAFFSETLIKF